jgi:quinone-modifying oxidoreductase subunit QmoC
MIWVQWGLKDKLMADPAVWMCHQCGLCNSYCPRDAKPADVMAALRDYSITHYAVPGFMGEALSEAKYLPLLFAIPALIFLAILGWLGNLAALPTGPIVFSKFMPIIYIEAVFSLAVGAAVVAAILGAVRYWQGMNEFFPAADHRDSAQGLFSTLIEILKHRRFHQCEGDRVGTRESYKSHLHKSHLAVFYGFLGLVVTTTSVGIGIYAFGYLTPWPLWHPVKILGNVSGVAVLIACGIFLYRRLIDKEKAGKSTYSDWLFLWALALTTLTGFLSEILRLANIPPPAYWVYFIHLVFIFCLLVYIPYSKFAHLAYRFVAMVYSATRASALR